MRTEIARKDILKQPCAEIQTEENNNNKTTTYTIDNERCVEIFSRL